MLGHFLQSEVFLSRDQAVLVGHQTRKIPEKFIFLQFRAAFVCGSTEDKI